MRLAGGLLTPRAARVVVCLASAGQILWGQSRIAEASLEELMAVEVTSVSRKRQPLTRSAAAVYVVTEDDIRRSGATSIPDALRMVPGLHVAQIDASAWAVSSRGFPGRFSNKMLVLIDGRTIYSQVFAGVFWDQYDIMLEDVERIEVMRGPGGTMWGANAVNGAINIITKSAKRSQGTLASIGTGNVERGYGAVRYGGRAGNNAYYRVFGKAFGRGHTTPDEWDRWRAGRAGARVDWELNSRDMLSVHGDMHEMRSRQQVSRGFLLDQDGYLNDRIQGSGGYGAVRWERVYSERSDLAVQSYFNRENRQEGLGFIQSNTADLDIQHRVEAGRRHEVLWGGGFRHIWDNSTGGPIHPPPLVQPAGRHDNLWSAFTQDDVTLVPDRFVVSAGAKFQHNNYSGFEIQPTVRAMWTPSKKHAIWGAFSRAVRTPTRRDHDARVEYALPAPLPRGSVGIIQGNPHFEPERLISYEAGWRWQPSGRFSTDVAGFWGGYRGLQGIRPTAPRLGVNNRLEIPIEFFNETSANTHGVEVATQTQLRRNWKLEVNYSYYSSREDREKVFSFWSGGFPKHTAQARSSWMLRRGLSLSVAAYATDRLERINIPGYVRMDGRLAWRVGEFSEFSAGVNNAQTDSHREFKSEDLVRTGSMRRAYYLRMTWGR